MPEVAKAGRQEAVKELKRSLILEAARRVFESEGLDGASMRVIAKEAGYTAGAIYFHFPGKEAIYAAVLEESLDRMLVEVECAVEAAAPGPAARLRAAALAFFDFYDANPRDLDLGFYLFRGGMRPRGLSSELDRKLNAKLLAGLAPIGAAARDLGLDEAAAEAVMADAFGHASGLLLLDHTHRIRLFAAEARRLMEGYLDRLLADLERRP